jgi:hypothetical protein
MGALLVAGSLCGVGSGGAAERPYEPGGMWMPSQIAEVQGETLKKMGLELDPKVFDNLLEFPLNAIVSLGGGSASFVSPDGLVVTNHHCIRGPLQYNSKEGQNLLQDGYTAKTRADELPGGPTARMTVTTAVTNVTDRLLDGLRDIQNDLERYKTIEKRKKELVKEAEAATPGTRCEVAAYYGGSKYYLITRLEIRDVRLVWAPHERVGNFGGDIDNWMWPRHCGDFSLLRAYVGPDGKPADYSKDNVPYQSKSYFKLAGKGIQEGDLAMVIGYPGRTQRIATAYEVREILNWEYPRAVELAQKHIDCLRAVSKGNEELIIKVTDTVERQENGKKKRQGVLEAAKTIGLADKKAAEEKKLKDWIAATPERTKKYDDIIEQIDALLQEQAKNREKNLIFGKIVGSSTLLSSAVTIARLAEERPKPDLEREAGYQERDWQRIEQAQERAQKNYARVIEQGVLELFLGEAAALPAGQRPVIYVELFGAEKADAATIKAKVSELLDKTPLADLDKRIETAAQGRSGKPEKIHRSSDPTGPQGVAR